MRIIFFGTPELAVPSLAALAEAHDVCAVVSQPDRPSGRGKALLPPPVKQWAVEHGIPVVQPVKLNDGAFEAWLREQRPEVCALTAYGRILKQPILDVAPHGILNMHPSLLPLYRGPSPIQSAVLNGETETGITIMRLSLDMDAGDVLLQERVPIDPEDTGATLSDRLATLGGDKFREAVDRLAHGEATFMAQEHERATYCRLIEKRDGQIHWARPAREIHNLVRGAQPWPMAHCMLRGQVVRILKTHVLSETVGTAAPGTVTASAKDRLFVATGDAAIAILTIQAPGKRALPISEFLRGCAIHVGERFESIP